MFFLIVLLRFSEKAPPLALPDKNSLSLSPGLVCPPPYPPKADIRVSYVLNFNVGSVWCLYLFSYCAPRLDGLFE